MEIIIVFCLLLLLAYVFDLTSAKTRIPSVMLLLFLGWLVRQLATLFKVPPLPDFSYILPILGTVGLILIVLEGALELELNKSKLPIIGKSFFGSVFSILGMSFLITFAFMYMGSGHNSLKDTLCNAIPFCIISSAIAIPSVRGLRREHREFVIYETSLSDIIGVLYFNFISFNTEFGFHSFVHFGLELFIIVIVSVVGTIGLSYLLSKIAHHVKFVPIILLVILIYAISKIYHLPGLIFILFFGLAIGNINKLENNRWAGYLHTGELKVEVKKFRELTTEGTFLIRALFFLLFGYLMDAADVLNPQTILWALGIVATCFSIRALQLKLSNQPIMPLVFVAPRGLITILLFLSIETAHQIALVNKSLIIQVILLSSIVMMLGLMANKNRPHDPKSHLKVFGS